MPSSHAAATEAHEPVPLNKRTHCSEKPANHSLWPMLTKTREKPTHKDATQPTINATLFLNKCTSDKETVPSVARCLFQSLPIMNGLVLVFLDNSSTVSLSDVHFFRKRVVLIVGCVASLCVGFSLVLVSMGHN